MPTITPTVMRMCFPRAEGACGTGGAVAAAGWAPTDAGAVSGCKVTGTCMACGAPALAMPPLRPMSSRSEAMVRTATSEAEEGICGVVSAPRCWLFKSNESGDSGI